LPVASENRPVGERSDQMKVMKGSLLPQVTALVCTAFLIPGAPLAYGQGTDTQQSGGPAQGTLLSPAALDSIVAPIALYPDDLLAQVLAAATYPLEIVDANRWLKSNPSLKGDALVQAAAKQNWEPCIQALVIFPAALDRLDGNLQWTTALGNAFLAQQEDVILAVQRLRQKAQASGALTSNAQQNVDVQQVEGTKVVVIQPANPEVIYVPAYNPVAVFGAVPGYYPYPAMVYPAYPTGAIVAASAISFTAGVAVGAIFGGWHGGGWGWGMSWGPRPSLYVNNTFINRYGFRGSAYAGRNGTGAWVHNPAYRGAVPYSNAAVANRYGSARSVATPNGRAAGVRTPAGAAGAVSGPNRGAAGIGTPRGAAGAVAGPNGTAGRVNTPRGAAGAVSTPNGSAARISTPTGSAGAVAGPNGSVGRIVTPRGSAGAVSTPNGSAARMSTPPGPAGRTISPKPSAFGGNEPKPGPGGGRGGSSIGTGRTGGGRRH
jgi:hypothetical protein